MKKIGHLMKYLIVSGDSNTTDDFDSISHPDWDFSYKKWPELLAERLDMKVINLGRSGQGNEYIYTTLQNEIIKIKDKSEIGLVIAAWSQATRRDYKSQTSHSNNWSAIRVDTHGTLPFWVGRTLGHYLSLQFMCERYNIPYTQFQMIELYEHYINGIFPSQTDIHYGADPNIQGKYPGNKIKDEKLILKEITACETFLDVSKFIGWPPTKKLGGYRIKDKLDLWSDRNSPRRVSALDNHPNEEGHKVLSNKIYELLKENKIIK